MNKPLWLQRLAKALSVLIISLGLSACGFHLLGSTSGGVANTQSMPSSIAIEGNTDNEIVDFIKLAKPSNVALLPSQQADLTLDLGGINVSSSVLSTNSQGGVTERRITMSVIIQMYDAQKNQLLEPTRLSTSRNFIVGSGYATTEDVEYERLNTDMARELANSINYRIRAIWFTQKQTAP